MRFFTAIAGFFLVVSIANAAVVSRRTYRNTEEILVPVTIIQDGEEFKDAEVATENELVPQTKNTATEAIAEDILAAVEEEEKELQSVEAAVEAQRRIDEAVVEEEINEAIQEEQNKEIIKEIEEEQKLKSLNPEDPQILAVVETEAVEEPADEVEKSADIKSVVVEKQSPNQVLVLVETENNDAEQPEGTVRQATQATPTQTTTQQNFVQQLIQNSPLGPFFNQITGQTTSQQTANDETSPTAPAPTLPGLFNPVTAVQNAAQSVVNSTTQAFQGLQQFASNLGNQFQNTLSGLGGQATTSNDATTARPPGPIQQLVNTFINPQQAQTTPTQQGPFQGLLNIFQGNRPTTAPSNPEPPKEPEPPAQQPQTVNPDENAIVPEQATNEVRDSSEVNDSFEDSVQPDELIVVNDDASAQNDNEQEQKENVNVSV
ncbi:ecdysone-inducible gene E2 [Cochliomyia hominivorax]